MLSVVTRPAEEPISLEDAKLFARVDTTEEDDLIAWFIATARAEAENITRCALVTQTWDYYIDDFPTGTVNLPLPPLQSVTHIKYIDTAGVTQTLAAAHYRVDAVSRPARIDPAYGEWWPSTQGVTNSVVVRFVAGFGSADAVPEPIKHWMLMRVASLYGQREHYAVGQPVQPLPHAFMDGLLDPFRIIGFP